MHAFEHPPTAVVVPFAGTRLQAERLVRRLVDLAVGDRDRIVLVDNSPTAVLAGQPIPEQMLIVRASEERSSYYARNEGAEVTAHPWLLFMDADCIPSPDLLDSYFRRALPERCGAVAGAVIGRRDQDRVIARYSNNARILHQETVVQGEWGFGQTANLLVRRGAWDDVGGFSEGIRSAGDADFCWRLRAAGWTLEYRGEARVEHSQRETLRGLVSQVARHAAGSAWLRRRYPESGHWPEPRPRAVASEAHRLLRAVRSRDFEVIEHGVLAGLMLAVRLAARLTSNRPPASGRHDEERADSVLCAGAFPPETAAGAYGVPAGDRARVEALRRAARPRLGDRQLARVTFREDESPLDRWTAAAALLTRSPSLAPEWLRDPRRGELLATAPAARRAHRSQAVSASSIDAGGAWLARDLRRLTGLPEADRSQVHPT